MYGNEWVEGLKKKEGGKTKRKHTNDNRMDQVFYQLIISNHHEKDQQFK